MFALLLEATHKRVRAHGQVVSQSLHGAQGATSSSEDYGHARPPWVRLRKAKEKLCPGRGLLKGNVGDPDRWRRRGVLDRQLAYSETPEEGGHRHGPE